MGSWCSTFEVSESLQIPVANLGVIGRGPRLYSRAQTFDLLTGGDAGIYNDESDYKIKNDEDSDSFAQFVALPELMRQELRADLSAR